MKGGGRATQFERNRASCLGIKQLKGESDECSE